MRVLCWCCLYQNIRHPSLPCLSWKKIQITGWESEGEATDNIESNAGDDASLYEDVVENDDARFQKCPGPTTKGCRDLIVVGGSGSTLHVMSANQPHNCNKAVLSWHYDTTREHHWSNSQGVWDMSCLSSIHYWLHLIVRFVCRSSQLFLQLSFSEPPADSLTPPNISPPENSKIHETPFSV